MEKQILLDFLELNFPLFSKYGLTRHKASCTQTAPTSTPGSLVFTCDSCKRTFGERRYLLQHVGSKRCISRKQVLDKTASFTLALTESPGTISRVSTLVENNQV